MSAVLVIFVDGLPYSMLPRIRGLDGFRTKRPLRPGLGYSVNIKPELFGGHTTDNLGFYNEWQIRSDDQLVPVGTALEQASALLERYYYLDRIVHRIYARLKHQVWNIPFRFLPYFHEASATVFSPEFRQSTIFSRHPFLKIFSLATYYDRPPGTRDRQLYSDALAAIGQGHSVVAAFEEFDGVGHEYGIGADRYMEHLHELVGWVDDLVEKFRARHGEDAEIFLFSDHGMANVVGEVELDLEGVFGRARPGRYLFFLDATMARVWIFDEGMRSDIEAYLRAQSFGSTVDQATREQYGIASRPAGDILFLLNEGLGLCPTFFGRRTPKALHGYAPELASQQGLIAYGGPGPDLFAENPTVSDLYPLMDSALQRVSPE
jgi:hypothetical protein